MKQNLNWSSKIFPPSFTEAGENLSNQSLVPGWSEWLFRITKELRRTLGYYILTHNELSTIMCEFENIISLRTLSYLLEDPDDFSPLNPTATFLWDRSYSNVTDDDSNDANHFRKRLRLRAKLCVKSFDRI